MASRINNRYLIIKQIGQGGMGNIYLVEDNLKGNAIFALKAIKQNILLKFRSMGLERFKNEYEVMTRLKHPNLVQVYDFGITEDGLYFIIMEYLKGHTLKDPETRNLDKGKVLDVFIDVLRVLGFIHSRNIIYRDIKPENIMITHAGTKLLDFGISNIKTEEHSIISGTFLYMAPEVIRGNIDFSSDIFSLGVLFYELFSGFDFFSKKEKAISLINLLNDRAQFEVFLNEKLLKLDVKTRVIFQKMLNYDKEARYHKCSEIIFDINKILCKNYEYETSDTIKSYVLGGVFINRKEELASLKNKIFSQSNEKVNIISGAIGLGKTTLFKEFRKYCKLQNINYFDADCMEGDVGDYHTISEIIKQIIYLCPDHLLIKYGSQLRFIDKDNLRLIEFPIIEINDSKVFNTLIVQNLSGFIIEFSKEAGRISIIYFDDMEYLDNGSIEVIRSILDKLKLQRNRNIPLFFFGTVNLNKLEENKIMKDFVSGDESLLMFLKPFNINDINDYIEAVFGRNSFDQSIIKATDKINERIGGNPLFLVELLNSMIEGKVIIKDGTLWKLLKGIEHVKLPDSLIDIVQNRIMKLLRDDSKRQLLQVLSSLRINPEFAILKEITRTLDLSDIDIALLVTELERLEILHSEATENRLILKFNNRLTKETIRETIIDKKTINLKIAHSLKSISEEGLFEEIAYHFLEAGDKKNAVDYLIKSADFAGRNHFHQKCIEIYDKILQNIDKDDIDSIIEILFKKTKSLEILGKWDEAIKVLKKVKSISKDHKKETQLGEAHNLHSVYLLKKGDYDMAFDLGKKALTIFQESNDESNIIRVYHNRAGLFFLKGEYDNAVQLHKQTLAICKRLSDTGMLLSTLFNLAVVYYYQGNYREALKYLYSNIRFAKKSNNKVELLKCYNNLGNVYVQTGDYKKAFKHYKDCYDLANEMGYIENKCIVISNIGIIYEEFGNYDKALECFEEKLRLSIKLGYKRGISISCGSIGNIFKARGDHAKALEYYYKDLAISEELGDKRGMGHSYANIGEVYQGVYEYEKAESNFSKLNDIALELNDKQLKTYYLINKGNLLMYTGKFKEAHEYFRKILNIASEIGNTFFQAIGLFGTGRICGLQKDCKSSIFNMEKAKSIFAEKNSSRYLCLVLLKIAEQYLNCGDISKAQAEYQNAKKISNKLSLRPLLFQTGILDARTTYHKDKEKAFQKLMELKNTYTEEIYYAETGYFLSSLYRVKVEDIIYIHEKLYNTSSDIIIKERLNILRELLSSSGLK